jgi:hypothetical protein
MIAGAPAFLQNRPAGNPTFDLKVRQRAESL